MGHLKKNKNPLIAWRPKLSKANIEGEALGGENIGSHFFKPSVPGRIHLSKSRADPEARREQYEDVRLDRAENTSKAETPSIGLREALLEGGRWRLF